MQLISIFMGIGMVALEFPIPQLKGTSIQRNFTVKIVLLLMQAFFAILFYQVRSRPSLAADMLKHHSSPGCKRSSILDSSRHRLHASYNARGSDGRGEE